MDAVLTIRLAAAVLVLVFGAWLLARVFRKAGYSGWLGLLSLLFGLGWAIALLILAFGDWPALRQRQEGTFVANAGT